MELNSEDEGVTPRKRLGKRVKRLRERGGLSQRALCERLDNPALPHSYLGRVERGEQLPSENLIRKLDDFFDADEGLVELWEMAQDEAIPDYGQAVLSKEAHAAHIQCFGTASYQGCCRPRSTPARSFDRRPTVPCSRMRRWRNWSSDA